VPTSPGSLREATTVPTTRASSTPLLLQLDGVDHAHDGGVHRRVLQAEGHARGGSGHHEDAVAQARVDGVHGHHVRGLVLPAGVGGAHYEQLGPHELLVLARGHHGADDASEDQPYLPALPAMGKTSSRLVCGRGITWTETSSPTRRAAAAPASVAALTAATSPRTSAVTEPAPIFSQPTSVTLAAFTMASAASIMATSPLVSTIPNASPMADPPELLNADC